MMDVESKKSDLEFSCREDDLAICPSAQPQWEGSVVIGVVGGTAEEPRVDHLSPSLPVTSELLSLASPVAPAEVFRFAAPCVRSECQHFAGSKCRLATKIVKLLPEVSDKLPTCAIRPRCRWWLQEGKSGCFRCAQVVTDNYNPSQLMRLATDPNFYQYGAAQKSDHD
jgi:hypothetical protein